MFTIPIHSLTLALTFSPMAVQATDMSFGCDLLLSAPKAKRTTDVRITKLNNLTFDPGTANNPEADLIFVDTPLYKTIFASQNSGYLLAPMEIAWLRSIVSFEDLLASLRPEARANIEDQMAISEGLVRTELKPLSKSDFRKWFQIYDRERVSQNRGPRRIQPGWSKSIGAELKNYQRLFIYDSRTGDLLGGVIFKVYGHALEVPHEAYKGEAKALKLEIRSFAEVINFGAANGLTSLNYLPDANLFGKYTPMSSLEFKASLGLVPFPYQEQRLIKISNTNILNRDFLIFTRDSNRVIGHHFTNRPRDLNVHQPTDLIVHPLDASPARK